MSRVDCLRHEFVRTVPECLDKGTLYVSLEHATMLHLCACGCGSEVALPLSPTDWRLTYDGDSISVWPSVGSWSLPCRSHYVIDGGRIKWAARWTNEEIEAGQIHDRHSKAARYGKPAPAEHVAISVSDLPPTSGEPKRKQNVLVRLRRRFESWMGAR